MCFPVRPDGTAVVAAGAGELLPPPVPVVLLKPIASKQLGLRSSEVAMVWMPGFSELYRLCLSPPSTVLELTVMKLFAAIVLFMYVFCYPIVGIFYRFFAVTNSNK